MTSSQSLATHVILVRHGQSLYNRDGGSMGDDSGLTELGWRQAHLVADQLAHTYRADALIASRLTRARQTAEVIGQRLGLPVELQPGIEEAETPYWEELPTTLDDPLACWDTPWNPTREAAPVYYAFRKRLREALARILAQYAGKTVIIVSHGGAIGTIMRSLFGGHYVAVFTENAAVTHLAWQEGRWRLIAHNDRAHLASLASAEQPAQPSSDQTAQFPWVEAQQVQVVVEQFQRAASAFPLEPVVPSPRDLRALIEMVAPRSQDRLLDVATGSGALALAFAPYVANVVGVDVSPAMLERAEQARLARRFGNAHFRWAEATALPFPDLSFDVVTCRDLLHYVTDGAALLAELRRVLAPEGRLLLDEIVGSEDPVKRATQEAIEIRRDPAFVKLYSRSEIERLARTAGVEIARAEAYEVPRELEEWLSYAAADAPTRFIVRSMLEAGLGADAAGLQVRKSREGSLTFTQRRLRLLAVARRDQE